MFVTGVVGPSQANVTAAMVLFDVVKAFTVGQDGFPAYKENLMGYIQLHSYIQKLKIFMHTSTYSTTTYIRTYIYVQYIIQYLHTYSLHACIIHKTIYVCTSPSIGFYYDFKDNILCTALSVYYNCMNSWW